MSLDTTNTIRRNSYISEDQDDSLHHMKEVKLPCPCRSRTVHSRGWVIIIAKAVTVVVTARKQENRVVNQESHKSMCTVVVTAKKQAN